MTRYIFAVWLLILAFPGVLIGESYLSLLKDLKGMDGSPPSMVINPYNGVTFVFWSEQEPKRRWDHVPKVFPYYRVANDKAELIINKRELKFWTKQILQSYGFSSKTLLWLSPDSLLVIGFTLSYGGHGVDPHRLIFNSAGEIISGPDTIPAGGFPRYPTLVRNRKGRVYLVGISGFVGVEIAEVYPGIGRTIYTPKAEWRRLWRRHKSTRLSFSLASAVTITSKDKLLICGGLGFSSKEESRKWDEWGRNPYKIWYILADLNGNFISEPVVIDLARVAFRKIPGIHLGGGYTLWRSPQSATNTGGMDLSKLPNGKIILSVAGLDEKENLCVYQVRFTPEGELIKPERMEVVEPYPWPIDRRLPVVKVRFIDTGIEVRGGFKKIQGRLYPMKVLGRKEYILYGFDEEGNFYEDRFVWEEREW